MKFETNRPRWPDRGSYRSDPDICRSDLDCRLGTWRRGDAVEVVATAPPGEQAAGESLDWGARIFILLGMALGTLGIPLVMALREFIEALKIKWSNPKDRGGESKPE